MDTTEITSHHSKNGLVYSRAGPDNPNFALVCIHGWACQASDFIPLTTALSASDRGNRYPIIAIDLPGHGRSPSSLAPEPSISNFASAVLALIHELTIPSVVLVGHSMGVRVVLETYHQNRTAPGTPTLTIPGLIFLDGTHYRFRRPLFSFDDPGSGPHNTGSSSSSTATPTTKTDAATERVAMKVAAFRQMFSARTPAAFRAAALAHVEGQDPAYAEAIRRSHLAYDREMMDGVVEELGRTAGSTAVLNLQSTDVDAENRRAPMVSGQRSPMMEWLQEAVPWAKQEVVVDVGHFPHVDQPGVVARATVEFVESLGVLEK